MAENNNRRLVFFIFVLFIVIALIFVMAKGKRKSYSKEEAEELLAEHEKVLDDWFDKNLPNATVKSTAVMKTADDHLTNAISGVYRDGQDVHFYFNTDTKEMYTDALLSEADACVFRILEQYVHWGKHVTHMGQGHSFSMDMKVTELASGDKEDVIVSVQALPYGVKSSELNRIVEQTMMADRKSDMVLNITLNADATGEPSNAFPPILFNKYPGLGTVNVIANLGYFTAYHTKDTEAGAAENTDTIVYKIYEKQIYGVSDNTAANTAARMVRYDRATCTIIK
ncbi:MAG: hypothetical protein K6G07_01765 [Lachnospiraceae bacterium]|nr:hypothetical protein [Lachnospiraceae bacterium]